MKTLIATLFFASLALAAIELESGTYRSNNYSCAVAATVSPDLQTLDLHEIGDSDSCGSPPYSLQRTGDSGHAAYKGSGLTVDVVSSNGFILGVRSRKILFQKP